MNYWAELASILESMDVPQNRKTDLKWLLRNLWIKNLSHPNLARAIDIIKELLKSPKEQGE